MLAKKLLHFFQTGEKILFQFSEQHLPLKHAPPIHAHDSSISNAVRVCIFTAAKNVLEHELLRNQCSGRKRHMCAIEMRLTFAVQGHG
jgi:hypothetical protein